MARARKLFPIYGSALANNMLAALVHDRIVDRFVAAYVAQHDRRGILGGPARERELAETMGREILLAMIVEVHEALPAFFGKKPKSKLKSEEKEAIDAFSASCWPLWRARKIGMEKIAGSSGAISRCTRISAHGGRWRPTPVRRESRRKRRLPSLRALHCCSILPCWSRRAAPRGNSTANVGLVARNFAENAR